MLKFGLMTLILSTCATLVHAKVECTKERFQFRGVLSDSTLVYFKRMRNGDLSAGIVPHVYRTASICGKESNNICLDIGGPNRPFFSAPKKLFTKNYNIHEWEEKDYIFKLNFEENNIYIIDAYLKDDPKRKMHSFYYSPDYGLLSVIYFFVREEHGRRLYISDTYVSTCPGFLSLD